MQVILSKPKKYSMFESEFEPLTDSTTNFTRSFDDYINSDYFKLDKFYGSFVDNKGFEILFNDYNLFGLNFDPILISGTLYDRKAFVFYEWDELVKKANEIKESANIPTLLIYIPEKMEYYYVDPISFAPTPSDRPQYSGKFWKLIVHMKD